MTPRLRARSWGPGSQAHPAALLRGCLLRGDRLTSVQGESGEGQQSEAGGRGPPPQKAVGLTSPSPVLKLLSESAGS